MSEKRRCDVCANAYLEDNGYSNWTVEGTDVVCLLDLNPALPKDQFYGEDEDLAFAETCPSFLPNGPLAHLDCDDEEWEELDQATKDRIRPPEGGQR